jgi:hypothetical protein
MYYAVRWRSWGPSGESEKLAVASSYNLDGGLEEAHRPIVKWMQSRERPDIRPEMLLVAGMA